VAPNRDLNTGFDDAVRHTTEVLRQEGFGIITEIDVKETLKKKINVDFRNYRILGACNPALAHKRWRSRIRSAQCCPVTSWCRILGAAGSK
jgi:uncharacterized protein (DUF302 family)